MSSPGGTNDYGWCLETQKVRDFSYFGGTGLTILPYLRSLSLYVVCSRYFREVWPTTLSCLLILRLYVIRFSCLPEVSLTLSPHPQNVSSLFSILS